MCRQNDMLPSPSCCVPYVLPTALLHNVTETLNTPFWQGIICINHALQKTRTERFSAHFYWYLEYETCIRDHQHRHAEKHQKQDHYILVHVPLYLENKVCMSDLTCEDLITQTPALLPQTCIFGGSFHDAMSLKLQ